jgi:hypothetical protein
VYNQIYLARSRVCCSGLFIIIILVNCCCGEKELKKRRYINIHRYLYMIHYDCMRRADKVHVIGFNERHDKKGICEGESSLSCTRTHTYGEGHVWKGHAFLFCSGHAQLLRLSPDLFLPRIPSRLSIPIATPFHAHVYT